MNPKWPKSLALVAVAAVALVAGPHIESHAADPIGQDSALSSHVSIPTPLQNLPTDPIGLGVFGSEVVFPQFTLDGRSSAVAVFNATTGSLATYPVPAQAQGQFAYAVAADTRASMLWIGMNALLLGFNVTSHQMRLVPLPAAAYPQAPSVPLPGKSGIVPHDVTGLTLAADGSLWIARDFNSGVTRFDPASGMFTQYPLPAGVLPGALTVLGDHLLAVDIQQTTNPQYKLGNGANWHPGYIIADLQGGTYRFVPHPVIDLMATGPGQLVTLGLPDRSLTQQVERVDTQTTVRSAIATLGERTPVGGLARSPRDGSIWVAAGAEIDHITPSGIVRYPVPLRQGQLLVPPAPSASANSSASRPIQTVQFDPAASAASVGPDGDVWFVAAGEIGRLSP